jgi:thymidylate synthase (FAD)
MKIADIEVTLIDSCGTDLSCVNAARVSMDKESTWDTTWLKDYVKGNTDSIPDRHILKQSDVKLLTYLADHKHFSPFNHAFLSFRVKAPIFVARQLVKHKFMPWNEISRRYVDDEPEFFIPEGLRKRAENIKQGSMSEFVEPLYTGIDKGYFYPEELVTENTEYCLDQYNNLLMHGTCPEQARMVLPLNTMTECIGQEHLVHF